MQVHWNYLVRSRFIIRMKLTLIMIVLAFANVTANVYSQQKVSLDVKKTKLSKILKLIEENSDYYFVYSATNENLNKELSLKVDNTKVVDLLPRLFARNGLQYSVSGEGLVVVSEQQTLSIKGLVTDQDGNKLSGATVRVKGSAIGKATDLNGRFEIDVPTGNTLVVSFTGYLSKEITIQKGGEVTVALERDDQMLSEVVVTALGVKSTKGFYTALNGIYTDLTASDSYGAAWTMTTTEILAQRYNVNQEHTLFTTANYAFQQETVKSSMGSIWSKSYFQISSTNNIIEQIEKRKAVFTTPIDYALIKGEALALRAMLHFD